jgi:squalene-hopene/tetraprenyl-beta-curcumene cyclase
MTRATTILLLVLAAGALRAAGQNASAPGGASATAVKAAGWDRAAAAAYLDDRIDMWFANATKLRTGEAKTSCVSCHSSLPYALARPALRRALHAAAPTAQEARLADETARRVESYNTHELLYEINDVKKVESRGTEAVLNLVVLVSADAGAGRREPGSATRKALTRLWETQRADGAWDWLNFKLEPYETVDAVYHGATLAALGVGMVPGAATSASAGKLRAYLRDHYAAQSLYNRTFALLGSAAFTGLLTPAQRDALVAEYQQRQQADGGWSLEAMGPWRWSAAEPPFKPYGTLDAALLAQSDGFGTGLIVYALLRNGFAADHPVVSAGLRWLKTHQHEIRVAIAPQVADRTWTAWRAYSLNYDREHGGPKGEPWRRLFMSDAATAFSVLALTEAEAK